MLKKIEPAKITFKFSDDQEVVLFAPTLAQLRASEKSKDETERLVSLLVDMSRGEMDREFINSLPVAEVTAISTAISELVGVETKN
ncbi:hypothetical protein [Campylobacter hyointestinalis]|uniref:hypothetical protein n=1 Tax=Campylobacter hyointestinalis TaxID=198 RepID=UPI000726F28E|nr:hypothetical protein [Campylobacter hyointestinalis]PPB63087.1 hypothetical protein CDQ72_01430 [Campylobacter hyointestinalis subsp. hyointestinalis]PPB65357.1 hypothetical protein CDQ73_01180 [Campylobacter hyointestinalis subsp. hyointestinalis]CUU72342.1 Uncharacterised protein [Campylobacter hyointestinalis subsp. hyointestinalis]